MWYVTFAKPAFLLIFISCNILFLSMQKRTWFGLGCGNDGAKKNFGLTFFYLGLFWPAHFFFPGQTYHNIISFQCKKNIFWALGMMGRKFSAAYAAFLWSGMKLENGKCITLTGTVQFPLWPTWRWKLVLYSIKPPLQHSRLSWQRLNQFIFSGLHFLGGTRRSLLAEMDCQCREKENTLTRISNCTMEGLTPDDLRKSLEVALRQVWSDKAGGIGAIRHQTPQHSRLRKPRINHFFQAHNAFKGQFWSRWQLHACEVMVSYLTI